ncbi:carboxypeptidase D-like [Diadema antillarum]|uniref:carboxypeptidase D-like n=1 Tax=Diadema antillarum TaxID=105358 RepID=UPI003A86BB40
MTPSGTHCLAAAVLVCFLGVTSAIDGGSVSLDQYHNYNRLTLRLRNLTNTYPRFTYLHTIGQSVQGKELWVLVIAGHDPDKHVIGRPEAKYVGNMHGDETVGREMLLHFADFLLLNYGQDIEVTQFLDTTRLHILVSMNPDGFEDATPRNCRSFTGGRTNSNNFDLNRNFPDYFEENPNTPQAETLAIMAWLEENQFVLSANLHGGALVANYAYDNTYPENKVNKSSVYSPSPDDDIFRFLATVYSYNHRTMHILSENSCGNEGPFEDGITNGADWYLVAGGMQDYNYMFAGCMEITLELGCCKYPDASELRVYWEDNRDALMEYIKQVHRGVKGIVMTEDGTPIASADVTVVGRDVTFRTTADGEYWRILLPGSYEVQVAKEGFKTQTKKVQVNNYVYNVLEVDFILVQIVDDPGRAPSTAASLIAVVIATIFGLTWII